MDPALAAIIGALVAALSALLASMLNARIQLLNTRESNQHQLELEQLKQRAEGARDAARLLREKYESAHQTLSHIQAENSTISTLDILHLAGTYPEDYSQRMERNTEHFSQLEMLTGLYIPQLTPTVEEIRVAVLRFWDHFTSSPWPTHKDDPEEWMKQDRELSRLGSGINVAVRKAKTILGQQSSDLFSQAQGQDPRQN